MQRSTAETLCPVCAAPLEAMFSGLCVACAWIGAANPDTETEVPSASHVLFTVPGHEVLSEIARGGGGVVYRARQLHPPREVAVKMLLPHQLGSREMLARFKVEAETVAALDHPAILPVYTADVHQGSPYFTMKLATGGNLAERRATFHRRWDRIAQLAATLADAVQFAHSHGVIHRDLKPANILFDESDRPYISDFGIAKYAGHNSLNTQTLNLLGTPAYLAPEVAAQGTPAATTAADIHGLGGILYELLAGSAPFRADALPQLLRDVIETPVEPPSRRCAGIPVDLEIICLRCLAKKPEDRLVSAGEVAAELRRWLDGKPIRSRALSPLERAWGWCRRRPVLALLLALLGLCLVGAGLLQLRAQRLLGRALDTARAAEADAVGKLHASLLSEATVRAHSRATGQRFETLAILERAARIAPTLQVRSAVAAALAEPDLKLVRSLDLKTLSHTTALAFGRNLDVFLTGSTAGTFELRRSTDASVLRSFQIPGGAQPRSFHFNHDGRFFSAQHAGGVSFWRLDSEQALFALPRDSNGSSPAHALHPTQLAIASAAIDGRVSVRDLGSGSERLLAPFNARVIALSFDRQGQRLAVVQENSVAVVDVATGRVLWTVAEFPAATSPSWSKDGAHVCFASARRNEIRILDTATGAVHQVLTGHTAVPERIAFHPDGRRIISAAFDMSLRLWDVESGRELLRTTLPLSGFGLSDDGRFLGSATDSESAGIFEWAPEEVFQELHGVTRIDARILVGITASPDGRWLATNWIEEQAAPNGRRQTQVGVALWDVVAQRELTAFTFPSTGWVKVAFRPDSSTLLYGCHGSSLRQRSLHFAGGKLELGAEEIVGGPGAATVLGFTDAGRSWIVHRPQRGGVFIWPDGLPEREHALAEIQLPDRGAVISPDGEWAAVTTSAPGVQVWSLKSPTTNPHRLSVSRAVDVCFSTNSRWLVAGNGWKFQTWQLPDLRPGPSWDARIDGDRFRFLEFSPNGRWLAAEIAQGSFEIRDAQKFDVLIRLDPPKDVDVTRMTWSADSSQVFLMGRGGRTMAWNLNRLRHELAARGLDW